MKKQSETKRAAQEILDEKVKLIPAVDSTGQLEKLRKEEITKTGFYRRNNPYPKGRWS